MYNYKYFYILEERDFIMHYLKEKNGRFPSQSNIDDFDINDSSYISFRRKIIADNLIKTENNWVDKLPLEQLKFVNNERLKEEYKKDLDTRSSDSGSFKIGDLIWYDSKKGEVLKVKILKSSNRLYDIKVDKNIFKAISFSKLKIRVDIKKELEKVPENIELKKLKTQTLLHKLKELRYDIGFDSTFNERYLNDTRYLEFMQIKKELANRPHIKRKDRQYNKF